MTSVAARAAAQGGSVENLLHRVALGALVLNLVLLLVLWLLPLPNPQAIPGRAPRLVVGE